MFSPCCLCFVALSFVCLSCFQHKISVYGRFYRDKGINYSWHCTIAINKLNNYFSTPFLHSSVRAPANIPMLLSLSLALSNTCLLSLISHCCHRCLCPVQSLVTSVPQLLVLNLYFHAIYVFRALLIVQMRWYVQK